MSAGGSTSNKDWEGDESSWDDIIGSSVIIVNAYYLAILDM